MNESKNLTNRSKDYASKATQFIADNRFIIMIIIVGAAIALSLLKSRSYFDIPRNEERYSEEVLQINYKKIDEEILAEFKDADLDQSINVQPNFNPDRDNPFSE